MTLTQQKDSLVSTAYESPFIHSKWNGYTLNNEEHSFNFQSTLLVMHNFNYTIKNKYEIGLNINLEDISGFLKKNSKFFMGIFHAVQNEKNQIS